MSKMDAFSYEDLIGKLRQEGSLSEYYRYLFDRYGTRMAGSVYSYSAQYPQETPKQEAHTNHLTKGFLDSATQKFVGAPDETDICYDFLRKAMEVDLAKKSLQGIYWIAEIEKEYNPHPYFRAIDVYYKLSVPIDFTKQEVQERVRDFEQMQSFDQWK